MTELTTTLKAIRAHRPCEYGWVKLLASLNKISADDEPLSLLHILESNGIDDALWALRTVFGRDNAIRLYSCFCARYSLDIFEREYPDDKRLSQGIETSRRFARGQATKNEMVAAEAAAEAAAAWAVRAAEDASWADAMDAAAWSVRAAEDAEAAAMAAGDAAWGAFKVEFIKLCRLEGEYGEVDVLKNHDLQNVR